MYKNDGINRRYSEGYKLKVLAELTTGKYNKTEISKIYRFIGICWLYEIRLLHAKIPAQGRELVRFELVSNS